MMLVLKASATLLISSLSQVKRAKWEQSVIHTSNEEANKSADGDSRKSDINDNDDTSSINADTSSDDNSDDNMNILEMSQF